MKTNGYQGKIEALTEIARESMPKLPYHNFAHAIDVYSTASTLALLSRVEYEERFLLRTAALLHDIIVVPGSKENEERSAEFAKNYLPSLGYSSEQIDRVSGLILATKMPQKPRNYLEEVICDADLDNLGRADFLELGEKVRQEANLPAGEKWNQGLLGFLRGHQYHTDIARILRNAGKAVNIQRLEKLLEVKTC